MYNVITPQKRGGQYISKRHTLTHKLENEMWRLYTNVPKNSSGKKIIKLGAKLSTTNHEHWQCSLLPSTDGPLEQYIDSRQATPIPGILVSATVCHKKKPCTRHRWAVRLSPKNIPIGTVMEKIGAWPSTKFPRGCGNATKETGHVFQCLKGYPTWERLKKVLQRWRERNRAASQLFTSILHSISSWSKGQLTTPPPPLSLQVARDLKTQ